MKLQLVLALFVSSTVVLAGGAAYVNATQEDLFEEIQCAQRGTTAVGKINGLIYAVVMESRGIYMSSNWEQASKFGTNQLKFIDRLEALDLEWGTEMTPAEADAFRVYDTRIKQFIAFRRELVHRARDVSMAAARAFGDNEDNRSVRSALNDDLQKLGAAYQDRANRARDAFRHGYHILAALLACTALQVVLLAFASSRFIANAVSRPLAEIAGVTKDVADGLDTKIPFKQREDEIGALARSIAVFQTVMHHNNELMAAGRIDSKTREARAADVMVSVDQLIASVGRMMTQVAGDEDAQCGVKQVEHHAERHDSIHTDEEAAARVLAPAVRAAT